MPFDPNYAVPHTLIRAAELNAQLTALNDKLTAQAAQINGLQIQAESQQSLIAALQSQSAAQQATIADQAGQITALQAQVAAIPPGVTQAQFDQEVVMLHNSLDYCLQNLPNYRSQQVGPLTITLSDPPTVADEQAIVDKFNQYITALSTAE